MKCMSMSVDTWVPRRVYGGQQTAFGSVCTDICHSAHVGSEENVSRVLSLLSLCEF